MTGPSTTFGADTLRLFHGIASLAGELTRRFGGSRSAPFRGLAPAIPPLLAGRADIAQQLYRGCFAFAGHRVECQPAQVFTIAPPDTAWSEELQGFSWLAHLEAPRLALYRAFARGLVQGWLVLRARTSFEAACRRLVSLSRHAAFLLDGATADFELQFLDLMALESRRLAAAKPRQAVGQLRQAIALLTAGLAFRGGDGLRDDALQRTAQLAATQILPDGGTIDRSPKTLLDLLSDLVPLRQALEAQRIAIPRDLNAALERAIPMLRMLCHGDDGLAVFHGVEQTLPATVRAVLARDMVLGRPLSHAGHTGYCRMTQGSATVIIDCGPAAVCDSGLAFEFSDGAQRIAGSCGFPANASPAWREAARMPAAHSTVQIDDGNIQKVQSLLQRRSRRPRPCPVSAELIASPHGTLVKARSSTHEPSWGITHHREFFLAASGHDFRGEDRFTRSDPLEGDWPAIPFIIRFHLHPSVKASIDRKGSAATLVLPNKSVWQFSVRGGAPALEESIYLASNSGPRACQQIVIRGQAGRPDRVNWAFKRLDASPRPGSAAEPGPRRPF